MGMIIIKTSCYRCGHRTKMRPPHKSCYICRHIDGLSNLTDMNEKVGRLEKDDTAKLISRDPIYSTCGTSAWIMDGCSTEVLGMPIVAAAGSSG